MTLSFITNSCGELSINLVELPPSNLAPPSRAMPVVVATPIPSSSLPSARPALGLHCHCLFS
eukprot:scaffold312357_cov31-Tisochrysis_lutea.AAC.1